MLFHVVKDIASFAQVRIADLTPDFARIASFFRFDRYNPNKPYATFARQSSARMSVSSYSDLRSTSQLTIAAIKALRR
jgi:hypothetical protein